MLCTAVSVSVQSSLKSKSVYISCRKDDPPQEKNSKNDIFRLCRMDAHSHKPYDDGNNNWMYVGESLK